MSEKENVNTVTLSNYLQHLKKMAKDDEDIEDDLVSIGLATRKEIHDA